MLIVASFLCYGALGTDLLPAMDEGGFILDYYTPAGTSLAETNRMVGHIEQLLAKTRRSRVSRGVPDWSLAWPR